MLQINTKEKHIWPIWATARQDLTPFLIAAVKCRPIKLSYVYRIYHASRSCQAEIPAFSGAGTHNKGKRMADLMPNRQPKKD